MSVVAAPAANGGSQLATLVGRRLRQGVADDQDIYVAAGVPLTTSERPEHSDDYRLRPPGTSLCSNSVQQLRAHARQRIDGDRRHVLSVEPVTARLRKNYTSADQTGQRLEVTTDAAGAGEAVNLRQGNPSLMNDMPDAPPCRYA